MNSTNRTKIQEFINSRKDNYLISKNIMDSKKIENIKYLFLNPGS